MTLLERAGPGVAFVAGLRSHRDAPALLDGDRRLTYAELADRVEQAAAELGGGRRLVLLGGANDVDHVVTYLACLHGGHVPIVAPAGDEQLDAMAAAFDPDVIVRTGPGGPRIDHRREGSTHHLHPELALLLSTSGSTGSPRLVRLSHGNLQSNAEAVAESLGITADDRAITSLPLHYCYGLSILHSHLARGASVVVTDLSVVDRCFWDLFRLAGCTSLAGVPHTFDLLDRTGFAAMSLPTLRRVTQAGGRLAPAAVERYARLGAAAGWDLVVMYGQTEATARMAYLPPHAVADHPDAIGVPIPGGTIRIDAPRAGEAGELVYSGPNVMLGYAGSPGDLALGRTIHELRTGDLARWGDDGYLRIVGRASRFAKVAGLRIDLDGVEERLRADGIDALCTSDDHLLVVGAVGPTAPDLAGRAARAAGLPASRVDVVQVDELPRLANGKPDHGALLTLPRAAIGASPGPDGVDPAVWSALARTLRLDHVVASASDTFVSLGGDSLSYVEASIELEDALGDLPADWHQHAIGDLRPHHARRRTAGVETSVLVRAVSIVLIVAGHAADLGWLGGAHLLLGVAGWNHGRFSTTTAARLRTVARVAIPSVAWLALLAPLHPRIHLDHVLLVHSTQEYFGGHGGHDGYWYVEAVTQLLLALLVVLAVPPVRRLADRHPFGVPLGIALIGLTIRFGVVTVPTPEPHDIRPTDILWLFALGWAGAMARTVRARLLVSSLLLLAVPGYFGEPQREVFVVVGLLALLWVPQVRLPRALVGPIGRVAAATLAIYLTHWQVFPWVRTNVGAWPSVVASILVGMAVWMLVTKAAGAVARRRGARRRPRQGSYVAAGAPT